jgi:glutamine transport system ATP-binding protein
MIKVENLKKSFGDNEVLKGMSVQINKNEVVVVIGPSGSGKSTFLRCLNKLEETTSGVIYVNNSNLTDKKVNINTVRRDIGMIFQQFNLFPHKTVLENITLAPIKVRKKSKAEAEKIAYELLEKLGLVDKAHVYPESL